MVEPKNRNDWMRNEKTPEWMKEFSKFRTYCPLMNSGKGSCEAACSHAVNSFDSYKDLVDETKGTPEAPNEKAQAACIKPVGELLNYCGDHKCGTAMTHYLFWEENWAIPRK